LEKQGEAVNRKEQVRRSKLGSYQLKRVRVVAVTEVVRKTCNQPQPSLSILFGHYTGSGIVINQISGVIYLN